MSDHDRFSLQLKEAGLRPTRQRLVLCKQIFGSGDRHFSAEALVLEMRQMNEHVSQATVYNALRQFTQAGMLRILSIEGAKTFFDTNTSDHHHYYVEEAGEVLDIPSGHLSVDGLPEPPEGMEIANVDVVIRLRRK